MYILCILAPASTLWVARLPKQNIMYYHEQPSWAVGYNVFDWSSNASRRTGFPGHRRWLTARTAMHKLTTEESPPASERSNFRDILEHAFRAVPIPEILFSRIEEYLEGLLPLKRSRISAQRFIVHGEAKINCATSARCSRSRSVRQTTGEIINASGSSLPRNWCDIIRSITSLR